MLTNYPLRSQTCTTRNRVTGTYINPTVVWLPSWVCSICTRSTLPTPTHRMTSKPHHLTLCLTTGAWICSCHQWEYRPRSGNYSIEKRNLAHKRHRQRFDLRKDWRVPGVGSLFKCPQCGKQVIKNRREHKFCSRQCAARHRYGWSISK